MKNLRAARIDELADSNEPAIIGMYVRQTTLMLAVADGIVSIEIYTGIQTVTSICFVLEIVQSIFLFVLIANYRIGWYR